MKYSAIILAAGSGKRTGLNINKILFKINVKILNIDYNKGRVSLTMKNLSQKEQLWK